MSKIIKQTLETAMGENINAQTKSESEYIKAVASCVLSI